MSVEVPFRDASGSWRRGSTGEIGDFRKETKRERKERKKMDKKEKLKFKPKLVLFQKTVAPPSDAFAPTRRDSITSVKSVTWRDELDAERKARRSITLATKVLPPV